MLTKIGVADASTELGDAEEGARLAGEVVELVRATTPASDSTIIEALHVQGCALTGLGHFAESEALLLEAHDRLGDVPSERLRRRNCRALVTLYESWHASDPGAGRDRDADLWRARISRCAERDH